MEMVTTCHGMNFPLVCSAFFAAISKPPPQGTSMAGGCAQPAAVAFIFVNMDDLPNHIDPLLLWMFFAFAALL